MRSNERGRHALIRGALGAVLLVAGLNACASVAGGVALLGVVGVAALTSRCYDYVDVTVYDADGRKTCDATVTAAKGKSEFELPSCYNASLTDGRWTLRASQAGSRPAVTTIVVDHAHDCTRYVQSVELTLNSEGSPPPARRTLVPSAPGASASAPAIEAPPSATSSSTSTPPVQPHEPTSASPQATPSAAPPLTSAAPPVGVFPDNSRAH